MADVGESLEYLERIIIRMQAPIRQIGMQYNRVHPTDYTKGKHDLYALMYDPLGMPRSSTGMSVFG
jgi:hypothetical protein